MAPWGEGVCQWHLSKIICDGDDDDGVDDDDNNGDCGDEDLLEERQDEDEAWSPHEGHVKGWAEDNSSLIFRDLDGGNDFIWRSTWPSTKKLCMLTSLPSHLSKHKEERQWGGDDDESVGEDVEDEGGGPPQPRVGWPLHMSN